MIGVPFILIITLAASIVILRLKLDVNFSGWRLRDSIQAGSLPARYFACPQRDHHSWMELMWCHERGCLEEVCMTDFFYDFS